MKVEDKRERHTEGKGHRFISDVAVSEIKNSNLCYYRQITEFQFRECRPNRISTKKVRRKGVFLEVGGKIPLVYFRKEIFYIVSYEGLNGIVVDFGNF